MAKQQKQDKGQMPYNPEAERAVLGGLLIDPEQATRFLERLKPDDFHEPRHEMVLRGMQATYERHGQVSAVLLDEELKQQGQLADVGQTFIHDLAATCESPVLTPHYVGIVAENWAGRHQLYIGNDLMLGKLTRADASEQLQAIENRLAEMRAAVEGKEASGFTLQALMAEELPSIQWVVPDLLPEELGMLGAKQKIGKSWMCYALCIAVASGGMFLGRDVERGEVLYLPLEDGKRRLQARGRKLLGNDAIPEGLTLETQWPRLDAGGLRKLDRYLRTHPATRLVVIDVFARVKPPRSKYADPYQEDYSILVSLKAVADAHHVLILVVHHTRKAAADDVFDELLGSMGLGGACDTLLVLSRSRGEADATLHVTGREIEQEREYALRFDRATCAWQMLGDAKDYASRARQKIIAALRTQKRRMSPKEIALAMGKPERYNTIKNTVLDMAKDHELKAGNDGKYDLPEGVESLNDEPQDEKAAQSKSDSLGSLYSLNGHVPEPAQTTETTQTIRLEPDTITLLRNGANPGGTRVSDASEAKIPTSSNGHQAPPSPESRLMRRVRQLMAAGVPKEQAEQRAIQEPVPPGDSGKGAH